MVTTNLCSGRGALLLLCAVLVVLPLDVMPTLRHASAEQWLLIGVVGAIATLRQMSMVLAIRSAPLSMLTPFGCAQIGFAATVWLNAREAAAHVASG
jgi:hypothetical protein